MRAIVLVALALASACGGAPSSTSDAGLADAGSDAAASATDAGRDAGVTFTLPAVAARCATPSTRASATYASADPVPSLALARGPSDLGLAFVVRAPLPTLAHFDFLRIGTNGQPMGAPISMSPVDMMVPGTVTITHDGAAYVACTVIVGGASCFRVDAAGTSSADAMVLDATAIAIAHGAGGVMAAWIGGGELHVGVLGTTGEVLASADGPPSIAASDAGYVVGYSASASAFVVSVDASGHAAAPIALGPARTSTSVAVAFTSSAIGASYVGTSGDAMAAVVTAGTPHTLTIGAGAMSYGQVSIARASDGFFATWSDFGGTIGGRFVDLTGVATGAPYATPVSWDDDAHAVVGIDSGFVLATNTQPSATPIALEVIGCP